MQQIKFKELPIPAYFTFKEVHYVKLTATKVRSFGKNTEEVIRSNPLVTYWGQDMMAFVNAVNKENFN